MGKRLCRTDLSGKYSANIINYCLTRLIQKRFPIKISLDRRGCISGHRLRLSPGVTRPTTRGRYRLHSYFAVGAKKLYRWRINRDMPGVPSRG